MNNNEILLLKLGEVVLKGLNRRSFEDKLVSNVRRRMKPCGSFQIYIRQSTIYVEPQTEDCDMEAAFKAARQVFGIVTVARAVPCAKEMDAIAETAKTYLADEFAKARTFKVESRRADKRFPMNSIQISQYVGGELGQFFNVKADMHHPDLTVYVEIREKYAYIHTPSVPGAGGLPIGMGGRAVSLLSGGLDSPVSSYMIARRGVELEMVHFVSPPYTSQQALDKVLGNTLPKLTVTTTAGSALTITDGQSTITGTATGGSFTTTLPRLGEWTVTASLAGLTTDDTVTVDVVGGQYTLNLPYFAATLAVTAATGSTVTATMTGTGKAYKAAADSDGVASVRIKRAGTYTVQAVRGDAISDTAEIEVTQNGGSYTTTVHFCVLTLTAPVGSEVTASCGDTTLTAIVSGNNENGTVVFYPPELGTWSITATLGTDSTNATVAPPSTRIML